MVKWRGATHLLLLLLVLSPTPLTTLTGPSSAEPTRSTVVFLTHAEEMQRSTPLIIGYARGGAVDVLRINYCIHPFRGWGRYFELQEEWTDAGFSALLEPFEEAGFQTILYVDATEAASSVSARWSDSVKERDPRGVLDLMTLNPERSWFLYLKAGMLDLARRFPEADGFAVDRLDRCTAEEDAWAARLLDEVRAEAGRPLVYVMNSLRGDQQGLASRAYLVGTDGVAPRDLEAILARYGRLSEVTASGVFYLAPFLDDADPAASEAGYSAILTRHSVVMVDDRPRYLDAAAGLLNPG